MFSVSQLLCVCLCANLVFDEQGKVWEVCQRVHCVSADFEFDQFTFGSRFDFWKGRIKTREKMFAA